MSKFALKLSEIILSRLTIDLKSCQPSNQELLVSFDESNPKLLNKFIGFFKYIWVENGDQLSYISHGQPSKINNLLKYTGFFASSMRTRISKGVEGWGGSSGSRHLSCFTRLRPKLTPLLRPLQKRKESIRYI